MQLGLGSQITYLPSWWWSKGGQITPLETDHLASFAALFFFFALWPRFKHGIFIHSTCYIENIPIVYYLIYSISSYMWYLKKPSFKRRWLLINAIIGWFCFVKTKLFLLQILCKYVLAKFIVLFKKVSKISSKYILRLIKSSCAHFLKENFSKKEIEFVNSDPPPPTHFILIAIS